MLIHPSHQPQARQVLRTVAALGALLLLVSSLPSMPGAQGLARYLPLHMGLETLAIAVAVLTFSLVWSVRHENLPQHVLLPGIAFLGVALLDFSHMLSYAGMPEYFTPNDPEKAIFFWLAARLLGALALLAAAVPWRERRLPPHAPWVLLALVLTLVGALHALFFFAPGWLPRTFVPGQGLTPAKIAAEYALIALNLLAAAVLLWRLRQPRSQNTSGLFATVCIMALGEFFFTLYAEVSDVYNLFGHLYKVVAYAFLYRAIFVETVQNPYRLLRDSQRRLRATLDALPDLLFELDEQGRFLSVHASRPEELAVPTAQLLGRSLTDVIPAQALGASVEAIAEARQHGLSRGKTIALPVLGGGVRWFELSVARKPSVSGQHEGFVAISRDITERRQTELALLKLSEAVEQSPQSIVITDLDARIEYVNAAFTRSSGYSAAEAIGSNPRLLQSGKTPASTYQAMWAQLTQGKPWQGELVNRHKSGQEYVESVLISPVRNAAGEVIHYLAHKEDITEKKRTAERIQQLSRQDPLTGLPNRSLLQEHFAHARAQDEHLAVLWIDLDHFKEVNDTLGHVMGDMLLLEMARRLRNTLRLQDVLSRHAGDDFVALLPGMEQGGAAELAAALLASLAQPFTLAAQEITVTGSIGIAVCPGDATQFDTLLKHAETAMYRVKEDSRNSYCFFMPEMQERTARTLALGHALRLAQQRGELHLAYQPQMDLASGRITGAEALMRWDSPQWGAVSPAEFIPLAEASGLIVAMGEWALREALAQLRAWQDQGLAPLTVAVNLSAVQFNQPDLPEVVDHLLQQAGVAPQCLELELTEAVAMKNPEVAAQRIEALREKGIRLSIDDFGTGYSSLSYLKRFKIHTLKIDQSFVRDLGCDPDDQAIATAIIQLARSLELSTIAEGVETAEQLQWLQARGCDAVQGYHLSRPLAPAAFAAFVRSRQAAPAPVQSA